MDSIAGNPMKSAFLGLILACSTYIGYTITKFKSNKRAFQKGLPFKHQLMSHRGGSRESVENTLPAFRNSAGMGVDLLEMDVQYTKDKKIVIFHDDNLGRLCGVTDRHISDYNYCDLPLILIPKDLLNLNQNPESTRIPLFLELIKEFPKYPMQIDVKNGPEEMIIEVGNLIREYEREKFTVWGSFIPSRNNLCYKHFGSTIPLFFDYSRCFQAYALYRIGCLQMMGLKESALIMPNFKFLMGRAWIRALNKAGVSVIVFAPGIGALNTVAEWESARESGANGICTDKPSLLLKWLQSNSLTEMIY